MAAVVGLLSLGMGATIAVLSVGETLFVQPPAGVADPGALRRLYVRTNRSLGDVTVIRSEVSYPGFVALRRALSEHASVAGYAVADSERVGIDPSPARLAYASADLLQILGVQTQRGRLFRSGEDEMGVVSPVAVISDWFWNSRFGRDSAVIGQSIEIAAQRYRIVGVTAAGFAGPDLSRTDVWLPISMLPQRPMSRPWYTEWRSAPVVRVVARTRSETEEEWLNASGTVALRQGEIANTPRPDTGLVVLTGPILESMGPTVRPSSQAAITRRLFGVSAVLLLIAFANAANLLLARTLGRRQELAVRIALGATRGRLLSQLLVESLLLSAAALVVAIIPGVWGATALRQLLLPGVLLHGSLLDLRILAAAAGIMVVGGCAIGLVAALRLDTAGLSAQIGYRRSTAGSLSSTQALLAGLQMTLSVILLVGAVLFIESFRGVRAIDLGYDVDRVVYGTVSFRDPQTRFVDPFSDQRSAERAKGLVAAARRLDPVSRVVMTAVAAGGPMNTLRMTRLFLDNGQPAPLISKRDPIEMPVSAEYIETVGMRLHRGRFFNRSEEAAKAPVAVVNETAAKAFWPGTTDPIGKCLFLRTATAPCSTVIGVVQDPHLETMIEEPTAQVFVPVKTPSFVIVRAGRGQAEMVAEMLRGELRNQFPEAVVSVITMQRALEPKLRPWRLAAALFSIFGGLALAIAALGLYSVISYSVSQKTRELGIRSALGATRGRIVRSTIKTGLGPSLAGLAVGVVAAVLLSPTVTSLLYAVTPLNAGIIARVSVVLVAVAVGASLVPAWRAARVDPVQLMRIE